MWLLTTVGFFSVVEKASDRNNDTLTIRGRVKQDLANLRSEYLPLASDILEHTGTDYPYRMVVSRSNFAAAIARIAVDIDYSNFKNAVAERQGSGRAYVYGEVWSSLASLEDGTD